MAQKQASTQSSTMSPSRIDEKPEVLLLGSIVHAQAEWDALADIATLRQVTEGDRAGFLKDCDNGVYDKVTAISRTFDSVNITGRIDEELVSHLPRSLRTISHNGAGYDQIDVAPCTKREIAVSNTPKAVDNATANVGMYLLLGALRRSWQPVSALRKGQWRGNMGLGHDPEGKVLGVLGMGGIGTAMAKRAAGFQMQIQYHNRHELPAAENPAQAKYVSFEELLRTSDVISVHVPLSPATTHLIGREQFSIMKDGAIIINTARGAVIDENALVEALESGKLFSAGLDVYEKEPEIHPKLVANDKVVLAPHIGTATFETQKAMEVLVIDNVKSSIQNGTLITQVPEQRMKSRLS